jgi:hypothetical protein
MTDKAPEGQLTGPDAALADVQLGELRRAVSAFWEWMAAHPELSDPGSATRSTWVGEALVKADHLAGCAQSVDEVCCKGDLPTDWQRVRALVAAQDGQATTFGTLVTAAGGQVATPDPRPDGFYGRVEIPGMRNHTGWVTEETRFGTQLAVIRDWNGAVIAEMGIGPACRVLHLPTPLKPPEHYAEDDDPSGEGWDREDPF